MTTREKLAAVLMGPLKAEFADKEKLDDLCAIVEEERDSAIEDAAKAVETHGPLPCTYEYMAKSIRALKKAGGR